MVQCGDMERPPDNDKKRNKYLLARCNLTDMILHLSICRAIESFSHSVCSHCATQTFTHSIVTSLEEIESLSVSHKISTKIERCEYEIVIAVDFC